MCGLEALLNPMQEGNVGHSPTETEKKFCGLWEIDTQLANPAGATGSPGKGDKSAPRAGTAPELLA